MRPTLGSVVCRWIERNLVHGEGDYYGRPIRLEPWQRALIYEAYELAPDGSRWYTQVLWGLPKGNSKTEMAAMLACVEFAGPAVFDGWNPDGSPRGKHRVSPDIPVAAASFEQADLVFGAVRVMLREGKLANEVEVFDTEAMFKGGRPGRIYRVAAVAGTNDGKRPSFLVTDELHEWAGNKAKVYIVLSNGRAKRRDAWELNITTAGWDETSLLYKKYKHGRRVVTGEVKDPRFLFRWWEADKYKRGENGQFLEMDGKKVEVDLNDPVQLEAAVRQANPACATFLSLDSILQRYREMTEYDFRRYHLNQWSAAPERWLPVGEFESCALTRDEPLPGTRVALSFDGSWSGDSTGLMGTTLDDETPYQFVVEAWEKPDGVTDWRVPVLDVEQAIRDACVKWDVPVVACDPHRWQRTISALMEEGLPMVEWPSHSAAMMVPGCSQYQEAVKNKMLTHDGDERLLAHVANAVVKIDARGPRIIKEGKDSPRKIDLAVCAVIGYDMYVRHASGGGELGVDFVKADDATPAPVAP